MGHYQGSPDGATNYENPDVMVSDFLKYKSIVNSRAAWRL
jgi:hypothetical protein